ncbi:MAG: acetate/propionate family kinase [Moraxellaceae bacterium]
MDDLLLALNVGSSSLKAAVYRLHDMERPLFRYSVELGKGICHSSGAVPPALCELQSVEPLEDMVARLVSQAAMPGQRVCALVHRVVHGGHQRHPQMVTDKLLQELEKLESLCPLHQPLALELVHYLRQLWPELTQVMVFDTAFHQSQPDMARTYALPLPLRQQAILAGGFHGISCQHVLRQLRREHPALASARLLVAHLGQGASISAIHHGESVACSMGFSTLDGLPMGTRCGELDPGVLLWLLEQGWSKSRLTDLLYHQSGLLGLSGESADMRVLLTSHSEAAAFAVDYFCYRAARMVASLACALQGMDAIVFTGGIGEHQPRIREKICRQLQWMGVEIDSAANLVGHGAISSAASQCRLLVVMADEEHEMCLQVQPLLRSVAG